MVCTAGEAKLVRCANGAVLDVVVDARPGSATFGQVMTFLLDDQGISIARDDSSDADAPRETRGTYAHARAALDCLRRG